MTIRALEKEILDQTYFVPLKFFPIHQYTIRVKDNTSQVMFAGYFNEMAKNAGAPPLTFITIDIPQTPPPGDTTEWLYNTVLAAPGHELAGATPILAAA